MMPAELTSQELGQVPELVAGMHPPAFDYDVDIIILMQDRVAETIKAVRSALAQKNIVAHVSVLDQGSSDSSRRAFVDLLGQRRNFGYYVSEQNLGVGGGRNFLSAVGRGKIIVALDNDAVFADDLVAARSLAMFEATPELGVIGFKILAQDGRRLDAFSWGYPQALVNRANGSFASATFVGAGHAIRRQTWTAAGGYDSGLFFTWEEYDFSLRAIALNWQIMYVGELAVIHNVSPEARVHWHSERMRLYVRNRLIVARKWKTSWGELLPRIFGYLIKGARNRRLFPALRGIFEAIAADRGLFKTPMSPQMRLYLKENENRFRDGLIVSFYRHVVLEMQADPK